MPLVYPSFEATKMKNKAEVKDRDDVYKSLDECLSKYDSISNWSSNKNEQHHSLGLVVLEQAKRKQAALVLENSYANGEFDSQTEIKTRLRSVQIEILQILSDCLIF